MFKQYITEQLEQRQQAGLLRQLICAESRGSSIEVEGKSYTNFAGNDYLGLATDSEQITTVASGATASPLVTGRNSIHCQLEQTLLDWVEAPANFGCLLFSSGFAANNGVISALFKEKNADARLIQDKLNHASLMDAGKHVQALGHCRQYRFGHNDLANLQHILANKCQASGPKLVVSEGVYSMDGDSADISEIRRLATEQQALFMLDDAHGIGITGDKGQGSFAHQGIKLTDSDIYITTFGKAIGAQGAAVIADQQVIDYLANFSREYIYSTHLSPLQAQAVLSNIKRVQEQTWRREKLNENIALFRTLAAELPFCLLPSDSAIQPVVVSDEHLAMSLAYGLKQQGFWVGAMRYPTVAKGKARLRVTLSANHGSQDIKALVDALAKLAGESYVEC